MDSTAGGGRAEKPSWRSLMLALCLLPVALPLLFLCLPLLCVAVAAVRFRRRRRKLVMAGRSGGCTARVRDHRAPEEENEGHRAELLSKYLQDQMELVGAGDGGAMDRRPSSPQSNPQQ
jgi:hypothetical protein